MAIGIERVAAILLAGGRATRFGSDKLAQPLGGVPLAFHAAQVLARMPFAQHIVVTGPTTLDFGPIGFDQVGVPAGTVMSGSIRAGVALAGEADCDACLIALADMPLVPAAHFTALLAAYAGGVVATRVIAAQEAGRRMVPALFPRDTFGRLLALRGDRGAAELLRSASGVAVGERWLTDVDTPEDLAKLEL